MRRFTSTFYSALIIFGMTTAEIVIGHIVQGKFRAEHIACVHKHSVSNASKCLEVLKEFKNVDWKLA